MKTKHLMLFALAVSAVSLSSCKEEPIRITAEEEYTRNFIKTFGLIDPKQDWNFAQASEVIVNAGKHAESVKVYCKVDGKYYIVADLNDVEGEVRIPIDIPKGSEDLYVKVDGKGYNTKVGAKLNVSSVSSRTVYTTDDASAIVQVSVSTTPLIFNTSQIAPILKDWTKTDGAYDADTRWDNYINGEGELRTNDYADNESKAYGVIPEHNTYNYENPNIVKDFWFKNVGADGLTIYPVFWNTNQSYHEIGIFYFEKDGSPVHMGTEGATMVRVKVFDDKNYNEEGNDVQLLLSSSYISNNGTLYFGQGTEWYNNKTEVVNALNALYPKLYGDFRSLVDIDSSGKVEYGHMLKLEVIGQLINYFKSKDGTTPGGKSWSDLAYILPYVYDFSESGYNSDNCNIQLSLAFNDFSTSPGSNPAYGLTDIRSARSLGVNIKVPSDLEFGFYLKRADTNTPGYFYSISEYNTEEYNPEASSYWSSETETGAKIYQQPFAATFKHPASGNQFFSFEDAAHVTDEWDLNDLVFRVNGVFNTSTVDENTTEDWVEDEGDDDPGTETPENPEVPGDDTPLSWIIAAEDLGATDDFDFNDVVFKLSSVTVDVKGTPTKKVRVKALAAGGTLPVYLHYVDGNGKDFVLGPNGVKEAENKSAADEWHQWFGNGYPSTKIINTGFDATANTTAEVIFSAEFNVETYSIKDPTQGRISGFYLEVNGYNSLGSLGGDVTNSDSDSETTTISSGGTGKAPQMFLIRDNGWRWPIERERIFSAYPSFKEWVEDADKIEWISTGSNSNLTCRPVE